MCDCSTIPRIRLSYTNSQLKNPHHTKVTDDFKSESFIIYKTFEIVAESLPQIYLQVLVLAKTWENWKADWSNISGSNDAKSDFCSDQKVFFVSLIVSGIQIGVTLQDLMERDVPYGVFPRIFLHETGFPFWIK